MTDEHLYVSCYGQIEKLVRGNWNEEYICIFFSRTMLESEKSLNIYSRIDVFEHICVDFFFFTKDFQF